MDYPTDFEFVGQGLIVDDVNGPLGGHYLLDRIDIDEAALRLLGYVVILGGVIVPRRFGLGSRLRALVEVYKNA